VEQRLGAFSSGAQHVRERGGTEMKTALVGLAMLIVGFFFGLKYVQCPNFSSAGEGLP
jgi:hypothetical protein